MTIGYIAQTIPAKILQESDTTLFRIAIQQTGDPLQWCAIAKLNGLIDPWIVGQATVLIPPVFPANEQTGILMSFGRNVSSPVNGAASNPQPPIVVVAPPVVVVSPPVIPPSTGGGGELISWLLF